MTGTEFQLEGVTATECQYGGEYPNCKPAPTTSGDAGVAPTPGSDPAAPASGGGGTSPPPDSTKTTCDPTTDPNCEQPLTKTDSTTILNAIRNFVRADTAIADTATRRKCRDMREQFLRSFNSGYVYRGGSNTTGSLAHYGATYNSHIHFDPWALDAAVNNATDQRELANTALHEAAHALGYSHPNGMSATGTYTDVPFNLLPPGAGPCLK
ncbi:hypothetical protein [Longimicrobium sp.]|uniref:hypothetical protein n=1 Tax=Longimicrobium sp. TaxID=2029185 RepID=UPI002C169C5A|nr:hypothetical protein [Longimicrobium sp.]HSU14818.1 hypothetical protein [Longimicrobium sp.]